jgi:hypothetical protein
VHGGEAVLGHPQQGRQAVHPLESELPADRLERAEVGLGVLGGEAQRPALPLI